MTPEEFDRRKRREYARRWRSKNRDKLNAYMRERYHKRKAEKGMQNGSKEA